MLECKDYDHWSISGPAGHKWRTKDGSDQQRTAETASGYCGTTRDPPCWNWLSLRTGFHLLLEWKSCRQDHRIWHWICCEEGTERILTLRLHTTERPVCLISICTPHTLKQGDVPQGMRGCNTIILYKNKGDRSECKNYRVILLNIVRKVFTHLVLNRLQKLANRVYPELQCGFRSECSMIDIISLWQLQ